MSAMTGNSLIFMSPNFIKYGPFDVQLQEFTNEYIIRYPCGCGLTVIKPFYEFVFKGVPPLRNYECPYCGKKIGWDA